MESNDVGALMRDGGFDVAYLVNQYPKVSHSFIRREILELERKGLRIFRISIRGWNEPLVDPEDIAEREKTIFVLEAGAISLLLSVLFQLLTSMSRLFSAARLAVGMMRGSDRPVIWHLIYLAEACWIARKLTRHGIRHIHAHFGTNPAEVAALASILANVTYSFTVHGPEEFDKVFAIHLAKKVQLSAFTVAISSYCRSQIYRVIGYDDWSKVKIVHCGIDREFADLDKIEASSSSKLVCVGRLCEQKGQLLLVEALGELNREGREFELLLVGDGELRAPIEELIRVHELSGKVRITGWASAERVKSEMLDARAVVLPSFAEGLPVVLIEAMSLGKPVLSTFVNGIPELVLDRENGWLFPAGSRERMLDCIRLCLEAAPEVLAAMGQAGRLRALSRHAISDQADILLRLFRDILAAGQSRE
jgi:colanic acid/amylovoran biosynthesis glycosyltransferase